MDFPINLTSCQFSKGRNEFRQTLTLLIKNTVGEFYQSNKVGSHLPEHGPDDLLRVSMEETLKQVPGTSLISFKSYQKDFVHYIDMEVSYQDDIESFTFSI